MNYDFSMFHKSCAGTRSLVQFPDGVHVYCPTCQVSANVEAIAAKVSPAEACQVGINRTVIGKQSANVNKGEYKV